MEQLQLRRQQDSAVVVLVADLTLQGVGFPLSCRVELAGTDSLCMELWGLFGMPVGHLRVSTASFQYYDALTNTVLEGTPRPDLFARLIGLPLPLELVLALLRQRPPVPTSWQSFAWDAERALLTVVDTAGNRLSVQLPTGEISAYELSDGTVHVRYSGWRQHSPLYAERMTVTTPRGQLQLRVREILYRDTPSCSPAFVVPADAERLRLE
jgi:hypothetical protein